MILSNSIFYGAIPYSEKNDFFSHPDVDKHIIVRGTDRFHVFSEIAKSFTDDEEIETFDFDPFDLSETFLIINSIETGVTLNIFSNLINQSIDVTSIKLDIPEPVLLMDISLFQKLYPPNDSLGAFLFKIDSQKASKISTYLQIEYPDLELLSLKKEQLQQSNWVSSLTYNLKFLAFISLIVSTCLMIQFFRFLGKQREPQFDQLFKLGISKSTIKQLFLIEIGVISLITTILALIFSKVLAQLSLGTFNQLITMFYFRLSATQIHYHWLIILKTFLASITAFSVAYLSYFHGKGFGKNISKVILISLTSILFIFIGLGIIFYYPQRLIVVIAAFSVIAGFFGVCVGSISFIGHSLRRLTNDRFIYFKMARDTLLKDPLSYGAIVFVISLSAGLVISMSIFIHSFSNTIDSWLRSVTFHDVYIQHQSNSIQSPVALPNEVKELTSRAPKSFDISTLYRIPFIYQGLPAQIVFRQNIADPKFSRFIFKERLSGPITNQDIFISEPFSLKHSLNLGDTIYLNGIVDGPLRIAGINYDFVSEFGQITANNALYLANYPEMDLHGIAIKAPESDRDLLNQFLIELARYPSVVIASRTSILDATMKIFNDTFAFTWFVVILTSLIAIFSLVNLLTIVCINRKNELLQLWHVGFNTKQLTRVILAQISVITTIASGISIAIGFSLYALIVYGIQVPTFNWSIFLQIPWLLIIIAPIFVILLSIVIGLIFMTVVGHKLGKGHVNESIRFNY